MILASSCPRSSTITFCSSFSMTLNKRRKFYFLNLFALTESFRLRSIAYLYSFRFCSWELRTSGAKCLLFKFAKSRKLCETSLVSILAIFLGVFGVVRAPYGSISLFAFIDPFFADVNTS